MSAGRRWTILVVCLLAAGCGGSASRVGRPPAPPPVTSPAPPSVTSATAPSTTTAAPRPTARARKRRVADSGTARSTSHPGSASHAVGTRPTSAPSTPARKSRPVAASPAAPSSLSVTLALRGGGNAALSVCGAQHHYRVYRAGTAIAFSGKVSPIPSAHWKVKLKIKACRGGSFVDATKLDASDDKHTGAFSGSFPTPDRGAYEVRAELYIGTAETARSDHIHFAIR